MPPTRQLPANRENTHARETKRQVDRDKTPLFNNRCGWRRGAIKQEMVKQALNEFQRVDIPVHNEPFNLQGRIFER